MCAPFSLSVEKQQRVGPSQAILTEKIVERIQGLRRFGLSPGVIAKILGFNRSTVKNVVYGRYWSQVSVCTLSYGNVV